jgi:hypothetical protein
VVLWKVTKHFYINKDKPVYDVMPHHFLGYLRCCLKWYGIKGLKRCYIFKKHAERKAEELNKQVGA